MKKGDTEKHQPEEKKDKHKSHKKHSEETEFGTEAPAEFEEVLPESGTQAQETLCQAGDKPVEKMELREEEISQLREKATLYDELLDQCKRIKAEYSNYQKRIEKEKTEWSKRAYREILLKILPVIDDLQRTRKACAARQDIDSIHKGIEILCSSAEKILSGLGVKAIKSAGERFDPNLHEAILTQETDDYPEGTVISEIEPGYLVGDDILLRPSKVVVSVKPQKEEKTE